MNTLEIEVTQNDIDHGIKGKCNLCPIARAVRRILGVVSISACIEGILVSEGLRAGKYRMTREAADFMCAFDDCKEVKPFTFTAEKIV